MDRIVVEALIALNKGSKFKRKPANWRERIDPFEDFLRISIIDPRPILKRMPTIEESPASAAQIGFFLYESDFITFLLEKIGCRSTGKSAPKDESLHMFFQLRRSTIAWIVL